MVTTKTALEVPADPQWRHVVAVTVFSAVKALQFQLERSRGPGAAQEDLSRMGDLSLLLDRALDDLEGMAGVTSIRVEVEADQQSALVTVAGAGAGDQIEPAPSASVASLLDPLAGAAFAWNQSAVTRSFRVPVGPPRPVKPRLP